MVWVDVSPFPVGGIFRFQPLVFRGVFSQLVGVGGGVRSEGHVFLKYLLLSLVFTPSQADGPGKVRGNPVKERSMVQWNKKSG